MRKAFVKLLLEQMTKDNDLYLLTADLGYGLFDEIKRIHPSRFFNVGSSEQLMLGAAAGLAMEKKIPICYSITPFLLYRPFEFIRNFMNHEQIPIKLVGGGRDNDYGSHGFTHWGNDDFKILDCLPNIVQFRPMSESTLSLELNDFFYNKKPSYINLIK
jgi:transketolase